MADPKVSIQVGEEQFVAVATTATGNKRSRLWKDMAEIWPDYEKYQKRTSRQIPVVVLEPR
jgi:deazaflavin-dependent oxidoreductase (nitroreductase family)